MTTELDKSLRSGAPSGRTLALENPACCDAFERTSQSRSVVLESPTISGDRDRYAAAAQAVEAADDSLHGIAYLLQPGELVLLFLKPHPLFIVLGSGSSLLGIALVTFFLAWMDRRFPGLPWHDSTIIAMGVVCGICRLLWQGLEWTSRVYILTDRRVIRRKGVLRVSVFECPLSKLQQTSVYQSLRERLFFLGSVYFATAGAASFIALWEFVARPFDVQRTVAEAIERYGRRRD